MRGVRKLVRRLPSYGSGRGEHSTADFVDDMSSGMAGSNDGLGASNASFDA